MGYRGKTAEKERARDLRALGWTHARIAAELGVERGTVGDWVRDVPFDEVQFDNLGRRRPASLLHKRKEEEIARLKEEGLRRVGVMTDQEFLVAGTALYAGEGTKRDGALSFANSDPRMIPVLLHVVAFLLRRR